MLIVWMFVSAALVTMALTAVLNTITMPRLRADRSPHNPMVSVLVPARNEAAVIDRTVRLLLDQSYERFELLILDDGSDDETAAVARAAAGADPRLRILRGEPLQQGWVGKSWACRQLAAAAAGDIMVFTDADVRWERDALAGLLALRERLDADVLTVWPTQETRSLGERLVVPLMALAIVAYLPELLVRRTSWAAFAAANGQCLLFSSAAYAATGGHAAVRGSIVEDVALARRAKQAGLKLAMADGGGLISCRMYDGWHAARDGFAKNILAGHGDSPVLLLLSTLFHWLVFIGPWAWLLGGAVAETGPWWPWWPLALVLLGSGVRALSAATTGQRAGDALLMPLSVLLMSAIAARSLWWRLRYGGPRWKGRTVRVAGES